MRKITESSRKQIEAQGDMELNKNSKEIIYLWRKVSIVGRTGTERMGGGSSKQSQIFPRTILGECRLKLGITRDQRKEGVKFMDLHKIQNTKQDHQV